MFVCARTLADAENLNLSIRTTTADLLLNTAPASLYCINEEFAFSAVIAMLRALGLQELKPCPTYQNTFRQQLWELSTWSVDLCLQTPAL